MRIIAGAFKGRQLRTVNDLSVRPATDRVRQTIFDILTHRLDMDGRVVLDLYAGSGSLGIEALSRGAAHATFVENNRHAAAAIEANLRMLGCEERSDVLTMDAMTVVDQIRDPFDIVFADPPYAFPRTPSIPEAVFSRGLVTGDGYLIIEHPASLRFTATPQYAVGPVKRFGRTVVTFFSRTNDNETDTGDLSRDV